MKIRESHLQNGIFIYKMGISLTKQDFKLQKEIFGLQTGFSACYLPSSFLHFFYYIINIMQNHYYFNTFVLY